MTRSSRAPRLLLAGALCLILAACQSGSGAAPGSPRLARILERQELRVGLSGSQPPLNMRNKSGELVGLEVDLITALSEAMQLEPRLEVMPFAELLPALEAGQVDLVISGMTITPERNARVAFAGPYLISGKSVLTKDHRISNVQSSDALNDPKRRYAALEASTSARFVRDSLGRAELVTTADYDTAIQMVIDDEVDALVADFPICMVATLRHPEAGLSTLATPFTVEPLGIALPADDPLFVNLVENYLATLENTGLLTLFKARWFSFGEWVNELP